MSSRGFTFFAALTASISTFAAGSCYVWTSPILPKFNSSDPNINPVGRPLTISETAWIVSSMNLALLLGPILSGLCLKIITKRSVILLSLVPTLFAHIICCFAAQPSLFILARILMGIGTGATWSNIGQYIAEISEDKDRGLFVTIPGITSNLGSLLVYVIGPYWNMRTFSIVHITPLIVFFIVFGLFVPDSPYDLLLRNRRHEAERSLIKFRGTRKVAKELTFIEETINQGNKEQVRYSDLLKDQVLRKGVLICVALMACQQFSGILAISSYCETIYKLAGEFIPSAYSPMINGVLSTITIIISSAVVDKMGRKRLMAISCATEILFLFCTGLYFKLLNSNYDVSSISWLPIISIVGFMISFNFALGMIPWIVMGEVFHSKVKPLASTISSMSNFLFAFSITICFPYLNASVGMAWSFWIFAIFMGIGLVFCVCCLPETKEKSFQEIQEMLK